MRSISGTGKQPEKTYTGTFIWQEYDRWHPHRKPIEHKLVHATIQERGCFYYVFDDGDFFIKKRKDSKGTVAIADDETQ